MWKRKKEEREMEDKKEEGTKLKKGRKEDENIRRKGKAI